MSESSHPSTGEPAADVVRTRAGPMSAAIAPFDFEDHSVRVKLVDGAPWFCARDVGQCLGLGSRQATSYAVSQLDDADRRQVQLDGSGGQAMSCVSESGLYAMIMQSRKPEAKRFQRWVTSEVLPSIRKTGRYEVAPMSDREIMSRALLLADTTIKELETTVATQAGTIALQLPAYELSQVRSRGKLSESTTSAWKNSMGRQKLTRPYRDLMQGKLWKKTPRGWAWRERYEALGWGFTAEREYSGIVKEEPRWFEVGRLALPLWVAGQERQMVIH